jgi:GTP-binding protein EngB required for normal cell division
VKTYPRSGRLADVIGRWIGKVEIVLSGADEDLREGEEALAAGDGMRARRAAHRVLARAPASPIGLALLADACEATHLDAELAMTLEELARRAPSRAEVWVRLARARQATDAPIDEVRDAFARALAVAESGTEERRDALLGLADVDLSQADGPRAELWLERIAQDGAPDVAVRRAEVRLLRGDAAAAKTLLDGSESGLLDGRAALVRGRALAMLGDPAAFVPLVRAMVLDMPGASEALSSAVAYVPSDEQTRTRVRSVVDAKGEQSIARWRAAFARAEGARDAARNALREAVEGGDRAAARSLLDAAVEDRDAVALDTALRAMPAEDADPLLVEARRFELALAMRSDQPGDLLDAVASTVHPRLVPWARDVAEEIARQWLPASDTRTAWGPILARFDIHAHGLGDLAAVSAVGNLAAERSRPVRLAIVGEFNAGKSTFINALIGADVAPTGVLPTTAALHYLRWAPDPFAKVILSPDHSPSERVVPLGDLRATLATIEPGSVQRVEIRLPIASLVQVEVMDTPGFNATDPRHARVARSAFDEADMALWLVDATQALKRTEIEVLIDAQRARLPIQVLVNKSDRIASGDLKSVLETVKKGLDEAGVASLRPPLAFSAKRALAGRLGDKDALEQSGWAAVSELLEEHILRRSENLKERALRRRAAVLVARLASGYRDRVAAEESEAEGCGARARGAAHAATRLEEDRATATDGLAASLKPYAEAWSEDLELVFVGRDRAASASDPTLQRYRVDRAVATIAPPLSRALASLAPEACLSPALLAPTSRAIVRTAAASEPLDVESMLAAIARAGVASLVEAALASSAATTPSTRSPGVLRELEAFAGNLLR